MGARLVTSHGGNSHDLAAMHAHEALWMEASRQLHIAAANLDVHSLLVARHGKIVLDAKFFPYDGVRPHDIASCTKSLTSTAVGIALSTGELDSLDSTLLSYFPEYVVDNDSAEKRAMTLSHALSMTSGFDCVNTPTELTLIQMQSSADWVGFALDVPMAGPPGQSFRYCLAERSQRRLPRLGRRSPHARRSGARRSTLARARLVRWQAARRR